MSNIPHVQYQATLPFNGTEGRGLFEFKGDVNITELDLVMGTASKDIRIEKVLKNDPSVRTALIYEKLATSLSDLVLGSGLVGRVSNKESLKVTITAGAPIRAQVMTEELKG